MRFVITLGIWLCCAWSVATAQCELEAELIVVEIGAGGAADICFDDEVVLALQVQNVGTNGSDSWVYSVNGGDDQPGGTYGETVSIGVFPIFGPDQFLNEFSILIKDAEDEACTTSLLEYAPVPEEDCLCDVSLDYEIDTLINSNGTPLDCSDDSALLHFLDQSIEVQGVYELLLDNELVFNGIFGDEGGSIPIPADGQPHRLTMRGNPGYDCLQVYDLPAIETACPLNTVRFSIDNAEACNGETICLPIRAENFDSILAFQFQLAYDPALLQYSGVQAFSTELLNFGPSLIGQPIPAGPLAPGQITMGWNNPLAVGVSLPPDSVLVEVCFEVLPEGSYTTGITFADDWFPPEVINADEVDLPLAFGENMVACSCPLSYTIGEPSFIDNGTPGLCLDDFYQITIEVTNPNATGTTWELVSFTGQVILSGQYGEPVQTNPQPIFDGLLQLNQMVGLIRDAEAIDCQLLFEYTAEEPPVCGCEVLANWEVDRSDAGTPADCLDDYYTVNVRPFGLNLESTTWTASDNLGNEFSGFFGEWTALGPYLFAETENLTITIADSADPTCSDVIYLPPLEEPCDGSDSMTLGFEGTIDCETNSFCVPLTVSNFQRILSMQFSVDYDTAALQYTGLQNLNPDLLAWTINAIGQPMPIGTLPKGKLGVYWTDPLTTGADLPDGATLVELCFEVLEQENHEITFSNTPLIVEILNSGEELVDITFQPLQVTCGPTDVALDILAQHEIVVGPEMPFALDIQLKNEGVRTATNIQVSAPLPAGITFVGDSGGYDADLGLWQVDSLHVGQDSTLRLQLFREAMGDSLLLVEVIGLAEEDADAMPGNGVDTDGDGHLVDDPDDEDDGDAWLPCPVGLGTITMLTDTVCQDAAISWAWNGDAVLPDGFILGFALYETANAELSAYLDFTTGQALGLPEAGSTNQAYYARIIAGPDDGNGNIDFADNCVRFGALRPVMWTTITLEDCSTPFLLTCGNPSVELSCTATGVGELTYTWLYDDLEVGNFSTLTVAAVGTYQLIVSDAWGCSVMQEFVVEADFEVPIVNVSQSGSLCGPDGVVELTAEVIGGDFYLWISSETGEEIWPTIAVTTPGTYTAVGIGDNQCTTNQPVIVEPAEGECNVLSGRVLASEDCSSTGAPLSSWLIQISGPDFLEYRQTDSLGQYEIYLPSGDFNVLLIPYSPVWTVCEPTGYDLSFAGTDEELVLDLLAVPIDDCPLLEVGLSLGNLRLCSEDRTITVAYENVGSDTLQDGFLVLVFPPELSLASTNGTFIGSSQDSLFFAVDLPLAPGAGGQFLIYADVSCEAEPESTVCVQALGFPYGPCPAAAQAWGGGSLSLSGECTEDEVVFTLRNIGDGTLSPGSTYIIIQDGVMLLEAPEEVPPLPPGESTTVPVPANGDTYVLQAEQEPFHPGFSNPVVIVEGCGTNEDGGFSIGFVGQFPTDDEDFYVDVDCGTITAAYDPNDKRAEPEGYSDQHYVLPERTLEYTIRFQNTGNDTAQTVVIRDTLSEWLDMCSLRPGVSSHPYRLELDSAHAIAFVFENILLPDSSTNLLGSQGFVEYTVRPKAEAPLETRIENTAAIYFDVNPPIFTNTTFHTLGRDFIEVVNWVERSEVPLEWRFGPNPTTGMLGVDWSAEVDEIVISIVNVWGQELGRYHLRGGRGQLYLQGLPSGYYSILAQTPEGELLGVGKLIKR